VPYPTSDSEDMENMRTIILALTVLGALATTGTTTARADDVRSGIQHVSWDGHEHWEHRRESRHDGWAVHRNWEHRHWESAHRYAPRYYSRY
jgi:hypothetical protein